MVWKWSVICIKVVTLSPLRKRMKVRLYRCPFGQYQVLSTHRRTAQKEITTGTRKCSLKRKCVEGRRGGSCSAYSFWHDFSSSWKSRKGVGVGFGVYTAFRFLFACHQLSVISSLGKVENEGALNPQTLTSLAFSRFQTTCKAASKNRLTGTLMAALVSTVCLSVHAHIACDVNSVLFIYLKPKPWKDNSFRTEKYTVVKVRVSKCFHDPSLKFQQSEEWKEKVGAPLYLWSRCKQPSCQWGYFLHFGHGNGSRFTKGIFIDRCCHIAETAAKKSGYTETNRVAIKNKKSTSFCLLKKK